MERLKVHEAAERLGVSKEAVRKRVQRGSLPHSKGADGTLYVYMDAEDLATQDTGETSAPTPDKRSLWSYIADLSALVAVFAAATYALGVFSLWAPIARTYTYDFATAWHAVSLVPNTMVAGLGVQRLLALSVFIVLLVGVLFFVVDLLLLALIVKVRPSYLESSNDEIRTTISGIVVAGIILLYAGWRIGDIVAPYLEVSPWGLALLLWLGPVAVILAIGLTITVWYQAYVLYRSGQYEHLVRGVIVSLLIGLVPPLACVLLISLVWHFAIGVELSFQQLRNIDADTLTRAGVLIVTAVLVTPIMLADYGFPKLYELLDKQPGQRRQTVLVVFATLSASAFLTAFALAFIDAPPASGRNKRFHKYRRPLINPHRGVLVCI